MHRHKSLLTEETHIKSVSLQTFVTDKRSSQCCYESFRLSKTCNGVGETLLTAPNEGPADAPGRPRHPQVAHEQLKAEMSGSSAFRGTAGRVRLLEQSGWQASDTSTRLLSTSGPHRQQVCGFVGRWSMRQSACSHGGHQSAHSPSALSGSVAPKS